MKRLTLTFDDATYYALKHNRVVNDLMKNTIVFRECVKDIEQKMKEGEIHD